MTVRNVDHDRGSLEHAGPLTCRSTERRGALEWLRANSQIGGVIFDPYTDRRTGENKLRLALPIEAMLRWLDNPQFRVNAGQATEE